MVWIDPGETGMLRIMDRLTFFFVANYKLRKLAFGLITAIVKIEKEYHCLSIDWCKGVFSSNRNAH